jgi:hypothetical protein
VGSCRYLKHNIFIYMKNKNDLVKDGQIKAISISIDPRMNQTIKNTFLSLAAATHQIDDRLDNLSTDISNKVDKINIAAVTGAGSASSVAVISVNAQGQTTSAINTPIAITSNQVTNLTTAITTTVNTLSGGNGFATLDALGLLTGTQIPVGIKRSLGNFSAAAGTLPANPTRAGDYYTVNVAGTLTIAGTATPVNVGDQLYFDGVVFSIIKEGVTDISNKVDKITGFTGASSGSASSTSTITTNNQGQITAQVDTPIAITSSQVTNFTTAVDSIVSGINNMYFVSLGVSSALNATHYNTCIKISTSITLTLPAGGASVDGIIYNIINDSQSTTGTILTLADGTNTFDGGNTTFALTVGSSVKIAWNNAQTQWRIIK